MSKRILALAAFVAAVLGAAAAAPGAPAAVVEVRGPAGQLVAALTGGSPAVLRAGAPLVRVGSLRENGVEVELRDVSVLGGVIRASRLVIPLQGFAGASVSGLVVDGRPGPQTPNSIVSFGRASYVVVLQEAVVPQGASQEQGLVGLRISLGDAVGSLAAGSQILVGLPSRLVAAPPRGHSRTVAATPADLARQWSVLGFSDEPVPKGVTPVSEPVPAAPVPLPVSTAPGPSSARGRAAVLLAEQYLGVRYVWGGASPLTGFDCSGLTQYVYAQLGVNLVHYAASQFDEGTRVPPDRLQPGDLVFFHAAADGPGHVGIYIGGGEFIQAPHTGDVVKISSLFDPAYELGYVGAVRPA